MTVRITRLCLLCAGVFLAFMMLPLGGWTAQAAPHTADDPPNVDVVEPTPPVPTYTVYLPLTEKHSWVEVPLVNSGFEAAWDTESSHQAVRINTDDGDVTLLAVDSILTPPGWLTWFRKGEAYREDGSVIYWGQPEVRSVNHLNPDRVRSGLRGELLFTVWRVHDAGFLQHVDVITGQQVRVSAWAHAWSNNEGAPTPDNPDDPFWSEGSHVGFNLFHAPEGTEGLDGGDQNFTYMLGIDPAGGDNPFADTVVWGPGMHIYNAFEKVPSVSATAQGSSITIFLRSRTLWRYKHNDAYWDDVTVEVVH